jgi:hypothetical protein
MHTCKYCDKQADVYLQSTGYICSNHHTNLMKGLKHQHMTQTMINSKEKGYKKKLALRFYPPNRS